MGSWLQRCSAPLLILLLLQISAPGYGQTFRVDTLARAPQSQFPYGLAFVPGSGDSFFFTEKNNGTVRLFENGVRLAPFAVLPVESEGEQGLLSIALDPGYPASPYLYVFCTRAIDRANVVVRFRDSAGVGLDPTIIQLTPRTDDRTANIGGALQFGPDGKLYVAVGDYGSDPRVAQDLVTRRAYQGKILRLNPNGSTPADGPFPERPYWSYGHRNPTGLAFDEVTGTLYCVEGGTMGRNAIYAVPRGGNLGWPAGMSENPVIDPLYRFPAGPQPALTSIIAYRGSGFPRLRGKLLFGGHANSTIWVATIAPSGDSLSVEPFFRSNAGFADIKVAPDGSIVFTNGPYISSRILKLTPVAPEVISTPPIQAIERIEYTYRPIFTGTPPSLRLVEHPPGMFVDTTSWTIRWTPVWQPEESDEKTVELLAENGGGSVRQRFNVALLNINDPPRSFSMFAPEDDASGTFIGTDPEVTLRWTPSFDPDGDTVRYRVECDTTLTFVSPALRDTLVEADSLRLALPRENAQWFWRVTARDRSAITVADEGIRRFTVLIVSPIPVSAPPEQARPTALAQNFPNPFNPSTSISYTLQRGGYVRLAVFNLLGQEVALLVDAVQQQGTHEVGFGNTGLPSGIYFYRLQGPGIFETKKMMIAR